MEIVFVDTTAFYSLQTKKDKNHIKARKFINSVLLKKNITLITTDYILCETLNLINARLGHHKSVHFLDSIEKSKFFKVETLPELYKEEAKKIFKKYEDKEYSFTDCTSFAFMKENGIKKAFAFDKHFIQFGFELIK